MRMTIDTIVIAHPNAAPSFLCLPERVRGMPIDRDILDFAAEIPNNRFQENPPKLIMFVLF